MADFFLGGGATNGCHVFKRISEKGHKIISVLAVKIVRLRAKKFDAFIHITDLFNHFANIVKRRLTTKNDVSKWLTTFN
jgi:hypothetical protein